ncbi:MAG: tRNA (guanosine(37)-N1)-methyltransferase TrmD [Planctomycetes bacterium]|nr:tRNA (guanosine(37)-N1)-methyltransferase TrmD [Planctomycetota bacterium]
MRVDIITIFPDACHGYLDASIVGRARRRGLIEIALHDPRAWAGGRHRTVDDRPYGGGPGMVLMAPPIAGCIDHVKTLSPTPRLLMTSPQGRRLDQPWVRELARDAHLIILCGHYEGIDERIVELYQPELFSIGDLVISGGELAAMVLTDAVTRLQPGALGNEQSAASDSFSHEGGAFDHPCFAPPREFRGVAVPEALVSGDHARIARWREDQRQERTNRPR